MNRTRLDKPQIVYIWSWLSTALAVCFAVYITDSAAACFAFALPMLAHFPSSSELDEYSYKRGLRDALEAVNGWIIPGDLPGDGRDKLAERNGLILASETILELVFEMKIVREK